MSTERRDRDIAIIGMAGRFPGARTVAEFWRNLRNGVESISFFSDAELEADPRVRKLPNFVPAGAVLDGVEDFDAAFFGINQREAEVIDPQHRLFLECAWEAMEDAGYVPELYPGLVGVYGGSSTNSYLMKNLYPNWDRLQEVGSFQVVLGNDKDYLPTRVSYKLNLRGPSLAVQTGCSTSLVAVHLACQSLLTRECDMALAGGASVIVPQRGGYLYARGDILSPDGHCRAFDARAGGTVGGQGAGVVTLKRLADALADGDRVRAVIRGSAINNDGSSKIGYTAPSVAGQVEVIAEALAMAEVAPETITYIEAHGTGTELGDPIEVEALTEALGVGASRGQFCALASLKTNVGHLDSAAGVAGLIKAALALEHGEIPASLHFETPNPKIDFAASPFFVNTALRPWQVDGMPRRAGVNSFGIGGTNAHMVLEEAPPIGESAPARPAQLLVLSATTEEALAQAGANLAGHLADHPELDGPALADVAFTLQVGRRAMRHRRALVCRGREDAIAVLGGADPRRVFDAVAEAGERPVVFLFPGQGAQYVGMGAGLYASEPVYREVIDRAAELLAPELGCDLRELLVPAGDLGADALATAAQRLEQTAITQPALFTVEYALARLWMEWGVRPRAMIGHSLGEYVAACLAGVFTLEEGLRLVALRGRLMQELPPGAMLAVALPEAEVRELLAGESLDTDRLAGEPELALAAVNAPAACTVSGPPAAVAQFAARLAGRGIETRPLHTSHAFHSAMMDPVLDRFAAALAAVELRAPELPYVSNLTGSWATAAEAADPAAWVRHLRRTVRFADGLATALGDERPVLLEVGPGRTLGTLARQHPALAAGGAGAPAAPVAPIVASLRHPRDRQDDLDVLLEGLGRLWLAGAEVDWQRCHGAGRRRVPLPTYPFQRRRCWIDARPGGSPWRPPAESGKRPDIADWFYLPAWQAAVPPLPLPPGGEDPRVWLVLAPAAGPGAEMPAHLAAGGRQVVVVHPGAAFARRTDGSFEVRPGERADYERLFEELREEERAPAVAVHLWTLGVGEREEEPAGPALFARCQDLGYYSLLFLVQAFLATFKRQPLRLGVVTDRLVQAGGGERLVPEKAPLLAFCKVVGQEQENVICRCVDVRPRERGWVDRALAEIAADTPDVVVAYRGTRRWVEQFEPFRLTAESPLRRPLRPGGVYLFLGGLGGIALRVAESLAAATGAKLALAGRTPMPPREEWDAWVAEHPAGDPTRRRIVRIRAIEAAGGEVLTLVADAADEAEVRAAVERTRGRFGALHGVFHAAGVISGSSIQPITQLGRPESEIQFRAKGYGSYALERALAGLPLDFVYLFSSVSAVLGGLGLAAYAAGNLYLDAFADRRNVLGDVPWLSSNWGPFPDDAVPDAELEEYTMTWEEGVEAFRRVLTMGPEQVVVATGDLAARYAMWMKAAPEPEAAGGPRAARSLPTPYVAPRHETERIIAEVWQDLLGIAAVGIHDNFFELGGHSLLGARLVSRLEEAFGVDLSLPLIFDAPTVAESAATIEAMLFADLEGEVAGETSSSVEVSG